MPLRDGTGPRGQGSGAGRRGMGTGRGIRGGRGVGPGGYCVCPRCQTRVPHQPGNPCYAIKCPECGGAMVREG